MAQALVIAPQTIPPGAVRFSATRTIATLTHDVSIQLTDSGGNWATTVGNIIIWGWQVSDDGGAVWRWMQWQPGRDDPNNTNDGALMPFGTVDRSGGMPAMRVAGADLIAAAGSLARLAIRVDTAIVLGATITFV